MIIIKVRGGLGNQLFQYAFGKALATANQCELYLDLSFYANPDNVRSFGLDHFNTHYKALANNEISYHVHYNHPWINSAVNYLNLKFDFYFERKVAPFKSSLSNKNRGYFDGYWQSEKYFSSIRSLLLSDISLRSVDSRLELLLNDILSNETASLHVRKSDYLSPENNSIYASCDLKYYQRAIEKIRLKYPTIKIFVFSDDFDWVSNNLVLDCEHQVMAVNNSPAEDMFLMSRCKHNIIANSTFSWWGAWLNDNPNKIVIAPDKWFQDEHKFRNNIVPDNWIKISNN